MLDLATVRIERTPTQRLIDHLAGVDLIEQIGYDFLQLDEDGRRDRLLEYAEASKIDPESIDIELLVGIPEKNNFITYLQEAYEKTQPKPRFSLPDPREGLNF